MMSDWMDSSRRPLVIMAVVAALLLTVILIAGGRTQIKPLETEPMVPTVQVVEPVLEEHYQRNYQLAGQVEASQQVVLAFEVAGSIGDWRVDEGQVVTQGMQLATLDDRRLRADLQRSEAAVVRALAQAELAAINIERLQSLVRTKSVSQQSLDEAEAQQRVALAQVDELQAQRDGIAVALEKSQLFAPFAGSVVRRIVDVGAAVAAGQPVVEIIDTASLQVRLSMPLDLASELVVGQALSMQWRDQVVNGVVQAINPVRGDRTRAVDALVQLAGYPAALRSGDLLNYSISREISDSGFWLPQVALSRGVRGLWQVYVVPANDSRLLLRIVQVIYADGERVFVNGALQVGDRVVVGGAHKLVPQQAVNIVKLPQDD